MIAGVEYQVEQLDVKGKQWKTAYLPVWLYSYQEKKGEDSLLHYVAVNARTKETMGSVPIHMPKLWGVSALMEIFGGAAYFLLSEFKYKWLFWLVGIVYFLVNYFRYRNSNARHHHETETKKKIRNIQKKDVLIRHITGLSNSRMAGANNTRVSGQSSMNKFINAVSSQSENIENNIAGSIIGGNMIKDIVEKNLKK